MKENEFGEYLVFSPFLTFVVFSSPYAMNMPLSKYQYLEAQISGKFVKQNKVGEYLVFSLFSYRR